MAVRKQTRIVATVPGAESLRKAVEDSPCRKEGEIGILREMQDEKG